MTYNEVKSEVAERLIKTWKGKIYKKMTTLNICSYLSCLGKSVDEYGNNYYRSINKKNY